LRQSSGEYNPETINSLKKGGEMGGRLKCPVCGKPLTRIEYDRALGLWKEKQEHIKHLEAEQRKLRENQKRLEEERKRLKAKENEYKQVIKKQADDFQKQRAQLIKEKRRILEEQKRQLKNRQQNSGRQRTRCFSLRKALKYQPKSMNRPNRRAINSRLILPSLSQMPFLQRSSSILLRRQYLSSVL